jgi:lipopolysaccharide/colanic/teichoic acid biosynthesis glycosyltransferase
MSQGVKRMGEIALASLALLLLAPSLVAIAVFIWVIDGRPILVPEVTTDRRGRSITLLAFRTDRIAFDSLGVSLRVQKPLPLIGSFLRTYELKKLPTFWNVLKGDCSLEVLMI